MLQGCMMGLFMGLGNLLVLAGFGSEGIKAREAAGKNNKIWAGLWMLVFFFAFFYTILFFGIPENRGVTNILLLVAPYALYIIWVIYARCSVKPLIQSYKEKLKQEEQQKDAQKETDRKAGRWECRYCGKINDSTGIVCKDCGEYR